MPVFPGSRFQGGDVLSLADKRGVRQLSVYRKPVVVGTLREFIIMKRGTRLDNIAQTVYGDSTMWWVIADANPDIALDGYFDDLPAGTTLRIPDAPPST